MVPTKAGFEFDAASYHRGSATHLFEYDPASMPPCMAVVSALSSVLDVGPTDMEPIAENIETDALNALVSDADGADGDVEVSWTQAGCDVAVDGEGSVTVSPEGTSGPGPTVQR